MVYRRFFIRLLVSVTMLITTALVLAFNLIRGDLFYILLFGILWIATGVDLLIWFNRVNRKLALFFNAIRGRDTTLEFPENGIVRGERAFHQSLNQVNKMLREITYHLEVQKGLHKTIMAHVETGILTVDSNGRVEFANHAVLELFKIPALHHMDQLNQFGHELTTILTSLRSGETKKVRVTVKGTDLVLIIRGEEVLMEEKSTRIFSLHNISRELEKQEMESWLKLIRQLNHEITNTLVPVTSISDSLLVQWLNRNPTAKKDANCDLQEDTVKGLEAIRERSHSLTRFIDDYRRLTQLPSPRFSDIEVAGLLSQIVLLARGYESGSNADQSHPRISFQVIPDHLTLRADEDLLGQVLLNLVKNAIECFSGEEEDPHIRLKAWKDSDQHCQIEVIDNGPGINPEVLSMIFVPFFTTKQEGSGIGLTLSRQILELHNASLLVSSKEGKGSTFKVVI